jgi:hypothetical protein
LTGIAQVAVQSFRHPFISFCQQQACSKHSGSFGITLSRYFGWSACLLVESWNKVGNGGDAKRPAFVDLPGKSVYMRFEWLPGPCERHTYPRGRLLMRHLSVAQHPKMPCLPREVPCGLSFPDAWSQTSGYSRCKSAFQALYLCQVTVCP